MCYIFDRKKLAAQVLFSVNQQSISHHLPYALLITWTTYGSWLPGDSRGWRDPVIGERSPQPRLETWARNRLKEQMVLLSNEQREAIERVIREHASIRGWNLFAVSVRSNHVHVVVRAVATPIQVRDQFKANATRVLRALPQPLANEKVWTKGGDISFIDTDEELERVILYVTEAQDRMDRK
jgi:REP element-mobilizing transposase RayT